MFFKPLGPTVKVQRAVWTGSTLSFCRLLTFFKINFFKNILQEHYSSVKLSGLHSVGPDLGPNYLQRLSEDDKSCHLARIIHTDLEFDDFELWDLKILSSTILKNIE